MLKTKLTVIPIYALMVLSVLSADAYSASCKDKIIQRDVENVLNNNVVPADCKITELVALLDSDDGGLRVLSSAELFRRGPSILADLELQGAKPIATLSPPRLDVIMSLISGLDKTVSVNFLHNSFGLHVEPGLSLDTLVQMGERHGFHIKHGSIFRTDTSPNVYVELADGAKLSGVLEDVLSTEPSVRTVNLNYVER